MKTTLIIIPRPDRRPRRQRSGMTLLIAMVLLPILLLAGMVLADRASNDVQIAAAGRRGMVSFGTAEGAIAEVLSDGRITLATPIGYAPDPGDLGLTATYPPLTSVPESSYTAEVHYLRQGPVHESSALEVRSIVYEVAVDARYTAGGARTPITAEFYRIAPVIVGHTPKARHYH